MNLGYSRPRRRASWFWVFVVWSLSVFAVVPSTWGNTGANHRPIESGEPALRSIGGVHSMHVDEGAATAPSNLPETPSATRTDPGIFASAPSPATSTQDVAEASLTSVSEHQIAREGGQNIRGVTASRLQSNDAHKPDNGGGLRAAPDTVLLLCAVVVVGLVAVARRNSA